MTENKHVTLSSIACSGLTCLILLVFQKLIKLHKFEKEIPLHNDDKRENSVKEKISQATLGDGRVQQEMAGLNAFSL